MNFLVLFLMSYILASTESVKNGLTEKLRADVWEKYEGKQYLPRSIEETDVMIKNLLELLDNMTVQIENMHVNVDLVPNSRVVITFSTISIVYNVISLLVTVYNSQSNSEELTHIEKGFRLIDARLAAFESRLDRLIDELRLIQLQIQLAPYHSIRIEIHLLLDELHATLQQPSAEAVNRFVIKCQRNDPLDNLYRLYRLVDEKFTANLLPSITKATEYNRTTFLKYGRAFITDASLATLLRSTCDAFSKTTQPLRQRAISLFNSTTNSIRAHVVQSYTVENKQLVDKAREDLIDIVKRLSSNASNKVIAESAHDFFRSKYSYTKRNWGVMVFENGGPDNSHRTWLIQYGADLVETEVAGRKVILHINGEDLRDFNWESRVITKIQAVDKVYEGKEGVEIARVLSEKLGDEPHGFMVLVRDTLNGHISSFSDLAYTREFCCRYSFPVHCSVCINCCFKWTIVIGKK